MIYTGYFAKTKKYVENGLTPISIAGITPDFFKHDKFTIFAPDKDMFYDWKSGKISNDEYKKLYIQKLDNVLNEQCLNKIQWLYNNYNLIFCCYEKVGDFCHRHILAEYLNNKLNLNIKEYEV